MLSGNKKPKGRSPYINKSYELNTSGASSDSAHVAYHYVSYRLPLSDTGYLYEVLGLASLRHCVIAQASRLVHSSTYLQMT